MFLGLFPPVSACRGQTGMRRGNGSGHAVKLVCMCPGAVGYCSGRALALSGWHSGGRRAPALFGPMPWCLSLLLLSVHPMHTRVIIFPQFQNSRS